MKKRVLGIDLGIASIGWSLVDLDDEEKVDEQTGEVLTNGKIIKSGVRIFTKAEHPKDGKSLAVPRREARSARRRTQRRAWRMRKIKDLFLKFNLLNQTELDMLYVTSPQKLDVWDLRVKALKRKLNNDEFARVLTHIAKHRGFKSTRKSEEKEGETGKMKTAMKANAEQIKRFNTYAEMLVETQEEGEAKRNKRGSYKNSIPRHFLEEEIDLIFEKQSQFNNIYAIKDLQGEYKNIAFTQRGVSSIKHMLGKCTLEKDEYRAPKESITAETFVALTKIINNLTILDKTLGTKRVLEEDEIHKVLGLCYSKSKCTYAQIRKELKLSENEIFKILDYVKKDIEKTTFFEMKGYHKLRKAVNDKFGKELGKEKWETISSQTQVLDIVAEAIAIEKEDIKIKEQVNNKLAEINKTIDTDVLDAFLDVSMSKFLHLSIKAMRKLIPYMVKGLKYNEACEQVGYDFKDEKKKGNRKFLPIIDKDEMTTVPTVNRAISQFRKLVNAIIREYGQFDQINIELARDVYHNHKERQQIEKAQGKFKENKENAYRKFKELFADKEPRGQELLKFRLYEEQDGFCIYSGKNIDINRLLEDHYCEVDHALPYSRSLDNSLNNRVLCLSVENQNKANKTPYEYFGNDETNSRWREFVERVNSNKKIRKAKRTRLLKRNFGEEKAEEFRSRNLNDTRYMARYISKYVWQNLEFKENNKIKQKVQVRNGSLTAFLRHRWGLNGEYKHLLKEKYPHLKLANDDKKIRDIDLHHAVDAIVVACATQGLVQRFSKMIGKIDKKGKDYIKRTEFYGESASRQTYRMSVLPWQSFKEDFKNSINDIFVSRKVNHKITGSVHKDTLKSAKLLKIEKSIIRKPIETIKLKDLENLHSLKHEPRETCQIYQILKKRLTENNNNPEKAFKEPVCMKMKDGRDGPKIKSVRIIDVQKSGMEVRQGVVDNGDMARVDVFSKENKKGKKQFYLVPVYVKDFANNVEFPNKAIVSGKSEDEWIEIDSSFNFEFSLFNGDLVRLKKKDVDKFGYYTGTDRATGSLTVSSHDRNIEYRSIGVKSQDIFEKYTVDMLGNYYKVKKEKRILNIKKRG